MRRLCVMAGAMSAGMVVSSIAHAQQTPKLPTCVEVQQAPKPTTTTPSADAPQTPKPTTTTWTLFLVTVVYKSAWSVAPVAQFTCNKTGEKDIAQEVCDNAKNELMNVPGLKHSNDEAFKKKGNYQKPICLQATAAKSSGGGGQ
jgi:hypothetical protein